MLNPARSEPRSEELLLTQRALARDPGACEQVIARLACVRPFLRRKLQRAGLRWDEAEFADLVQDTLLAVWGKLGSFRGESRLETWACGFALRLLWQRLSRNQDRRELPLEAEELVVDEAGEPDDSPVDLERVRQVVAELRPPGRDIVLLRHFRERSFEEIAEEFDMPLATVRTNYYRARERLRILLQSTWREEGS